MQCHRRHTLSLNLQRWLWMGGWLCLLLGFLSSAQAATLAVINSNDSGQGSLRQAMLTALATPGDDEIVFDAATDGMTIVLGMPLPDVEASGGALIITGNGPANTIIDGNHAIRPFRNDSAHLTLRQLTVQRGFADQLEGGAIYSNGGSLTIDTVALIDNQSTWSGAAIRTSVSPLTIRNSLFQGNKTDNEGAAIFHDEQTMLVTNSTFTDHQRPNGASTPEVIMVNGSTAAARFINVTLAANAVVRGIEVRNGASAELVNSLVIDGTAHDLYVTGGGTINPATSFNNLIGIAFTTGLANGVNGNLIGGFGIVPLVGPLGDYGGPTRTLPLLPGSTAIDAGVMLGDTGQPDPILVPLTDQRGQPRIGSQPDIGAFESRAFTLSLAGGSGQSATVGTAFAAPLEVEVTANSAIEPVAGGRVQFTIPASGASAILAIPFGRWESIDANGFATAAATANATAGGPYTITASAQGATPPATFLLTNTPAGNPACAGFTFPYTLSGADNTARVAELRQAIECANANATDDEIDLDGHALVFTDGPYNDADGANALPLIASTIVLRNGALERDTTATPFRLLSSDAGNLLTVRDMQFRGGEASNTGGAILARGPIYVVMSQFSDNTAAEGAAIAGYGMVMLTNVQLHGNGDASSRSVLWVDGYAALVGVLAFDNHLPAADSSLMRFAANTTVAELRHATIAENSVQGPLLRIENGNSIQMHNSILWDNQATSLGNISATTSIFPGAPAANGNLDTAPGFVATPANYRLAAGSPAIDVGNDSMSFFDMFDIDGDGDSAELLPDLDLVPRPVNGTVDMGAYEYQGVALPNLSIDDVSLNEGNAGTTAFAFTVSLSAPAPAGGVSFDIATANGTATAPGDYAAQSLTGQFIPAGSSTYSFTVQVNGDTTFEPNETFFVNVANVVNAVLVDGQGVGTINNDDADACAGFTFPYTLSGADNTARVANLRQAIECANANATADVIDLAGFVLVFDAADTADADNALPEISSAITLRNGELQRSAAAADDFRLLAVTNSGHLIGEALTFRNGRSSNGGAIHNHGDLELHGTDFFDNGDLALTQNGGAIFNIGDVLRINDNRFEGNAAQYGGALHINYGSLWLRGSHFENNQAVEGGALFTLELVRALGNAFIDNSAERGGAVMIWWSQGQFSGNRFERNRASVHGGAMSAEGPISGQLSLSNSLFIGNEAPLGAVLRHVEGEAFLRNVTISGHTQALAGSLFASHQQGADLPITNSILWGNGDTPPGNITIAHSVVEGGFPLGTDILDADPRFIDPANGDYRLGSGSPAIDAGANADVAQDSWIDIDDDGDFAEELDDLDGNPRRYDDAHVADTGAGNAPVVDMGAYERQSDSTAAGITVAPTTGLVTSEAGGTATFTVVLDTQPTADVSVALSSSDITEGTVAPASLTFTQANWNAAQTVTITGVDDAIIDGDIAYSISIGPASSADVNYDGLSGASVSVTNIDNDVAGAELMAFKSVVQAGTDSLPAIYEIVIHNIGAGDQADDPASHEMSDVLPPELALVGANATSGVVTLDPGSNTVHWNGALAAGGSVTLQIQADVTIAHAATISNQAQIHYDSDGDGSNDALTPSTDPAVPGAGQPTRFYFPGVAGAPTALLIPATGNAALWTLVLLMLIASAASLRRMSR